jgi:endoglucanase
MRDTYSICEKLASVPAVSGSERTRAEIVADFVAGFADEIVSDALGSLIVRKGRSESPGIAICARLDDAGFMVKYLEDDGRIRLMPLGAFDPGSLAGARVRFENGVCGVLLSGLDADAARRPTMSDLLVDVGMRLSSYSTVPLPL